MGYTHYWIETEKPKAIPPRALAIIGEIVKEAYEEGIIQREYNDSKPPIVSKEEVRFNGVAEDGHETFHYRVNDDLRAEIEEYFAFCKTARKPYDEVVMKVLLVLKRSFGCDFELSSDGRFDEEWEAAREEMFEKYNIVTFVNRALKAY